MAAGTHEEEGRWGLWAHHVEEVARTTVRRGIASGPDGIAVVDWNNVPPAFAVLLFNICSLHPGLSPNPRRAGVATRCNCEGAVITSYSARLER
jgi:hypothetical protein